MLCTFIVPDSEFMAIERQRFLSELLIASCLDSLIAAPESGATQLATLESLLTKYDSEQEDIEIQSSL